MALPDQLYQYYRMYPALLTDLQAMWNARGVVVVMARDGAWRIYHTWYPLADGGYDGPMQCGYAEPHHVIVALHTQHGFSGPEWLSS